MQVSVVAADFNAFRVAVPGSIQAMPHRAKSAGVPTRSLAASLTLASITGLKTIAVLATIGLMIGLSLIADYPHHNPTTGALQIFGVLPGVLSVATLPVIVASRFSQWSGSPANEGVNTER